MSERADGVPQKGVEPILVVANPASRSGKASERFESIKRLLDEHALAYDFRNTVPGGATEEMVSRAIVEEGFRTVVYVGGDGTFNQVAKGICQSGKAREVCIGMLPSGTANDQGKSFGISSAAKALEKNVEIIAAGSLTELDVGEVTALNENDVVKRRDLFFDSVGWGLSAAILAFRNHELEIVRKLPVVRDMYRDQMVYVRAAVHELALTWLTRDRFDALVTIDGEVHSWNNLTDMVISNTTIYAGDWIVDVESRHDDGKFELAPFRGVRDWTSKLILHHKKVPLTEEMVNRVGVSHSPTYSGSDFSIRMIKPSPEKRLPAQLDGDELPPAYRFDIQIHKRLLKLIVPEEFHWI
jgi:diacylglycerol kinase family enzyme